jgi:hypothetical protein
MASIIACRPPSIRLAISISPSRVRQLDRAHLAHVHAHRVGRAAELGVDGRERRLGGFLGFLLRRGGRAAAGDEERRRVGRLLVTGDAHVVEHRDDRLEDLVVHQLLGQVVVDLLVREEAARLPHLDEAS